MAVFMFAMVQLSVTGLGGLQRVEADLGFAFV